MPVDKVDTTCCCLHRCCAQLASLLCTATLQDSCYPSHAARQEAGAQRVREFHQSSQLVAHMGFKPRSWLQSLCVTCSHGSPSHIETESWRYLGNGGQDFTLACIPELVWNMRTFGNDQRKKKVFFYFFFCGNLCVPAGVPFWGGIDRTPNLVSETPSKNNVTLQDLPVRSPS